MLIGVTGLSFSALLIHMKFPSFFLYVLCDGSKFLELGKKVTYCFAFLPRSTDLMLFLDAFFVEPKFGSLDCKEPREVSLN
jgi:hypothetical protein